MSSMSIARARRNTVSVSIAHLAERLQNLETKADPNNLHLTQDVERELNSLDTEFWKCHYAVIDLIDIDDEATLSREQELLDNHDDLVNSLFVRIRLLQSSMSTERQRRKCLSELHHLQQKILSIHDTVTSSTAEFRLRQYAETIRSYKVELRKICYESDTLGIPFTDEIYSLESQLEEDVFDCCLKIRRLLASAHTSLAPSLYLESDNSSIDSCSITPQVEKELQGDPDMSLTIATPSTLENTNSLGNEIQTLNSDLRSSHDSIEPRLITVKEEPSTHPPSETLHSLDCCSKVVNSAASFAMLSSEHSTHELHLPIITCCATDFSHINGVDSSLNSSPCSLLDSSPRTSIGVAMTSTRESLSSVHTRLSLLSYALFALSSFLIESCLKQFLRIFHGRRYSILNAFAHSRLCIEIIRSLTPSHVT